MSTEFFNFLLFLVYAGVFFFIFYTLSWGFQIIRPISRVGFQGVGLMSNNKFVLSITGLPRICVEFFIMGPFFTGPSSLPSSFCGVGKRGFSFWQLFGKEELFYKGSEVGGRFFLAERSYFSDPVFYILFFQIRDFLIFLGLDTSVSLLYFFISRCEIRGIFEQGPIECLLLLKCLFSVVDITNTNLVFWISCVVVYMEWDYMMCLDEDGTYDFFLWKELKVNLFMASGLVLDIPEEFLLVYSERSRSNFNHYVATRMDFTHFYFSFHPYFKDYEDISFEGVKLDFLSVQTVKYSRLVFLSPISNFKSKVNSYSTILNGISLTPYRLLNWGVLDCWRLFINLKFVSVLGPVLYPVVVEGSPTVCWELLNSISRIGVFEFNCFLQGHMVLGDSWILEETGLIIVEHELWGSLGINNDHLFITVSGREEVPSFLGEYGVSHIYEVFGGRTSGGVRDSMYLGVNIVKLFNPSFFSKSKLLELSNISFPFYVKYVFNQLCSRTCLATRDFKAFSESGAKKNIKMYYSVFSNRKRLLESCPKLFNLGPNWGEIMLGFFKKLNPRDLKYFSDGELSMESSSCLVSESEYNREVSKLGVFLTRVEKSLSDEMRLGVVTCSGRYQDSYCCCVGGSFKTSNMCVCSREFILFEGGFIRNPNFFSWPKLPKPVFLSYRENEAFLSSSVLSPYIKLRDEGFVLSFIKKVEDTMELSILGKIYISKNTEGLGLQEVCYFFTPKTLFVSKFNPSKLNYMSIVLGKDLELEGVFDFEVCTYNDLFSIEALTLDFSYVLGEKLLGLLKFIKFNRKEIEVKISRMGLSDAREKDSLDFLVSSEFRGKNFDWLDVGVEYTNWSHKLVAGDLKEFSDSCSDDEDFVFVSSFLVPFERIPYFSRRFLTIYQEVLFSLGGGEDLFEAHLNKFCFLLAAMCVHQRSRGRDSLRTKVKDLWLGVVEDNYIFCVYFIWGLVVVFEYKKTPSREVLSCWGLSVFIREPLENGGFGALPGGFRALWGCFGPGLSLDYISENYGELFLRVISKEEVEGFEEV